MDYQKEILNILLDKYESSKAFRTGETTRRIMVHLSKVKPLKKAYENVDTKGLFHDALHNLKERGLLDFSWEKYEEGNLVDEIWLNPDPSKLRESCRIAGRVPLADFLHDLLSEIDALLNRFPDSSALSGSADLLHFLQGQKESIQEKMRLPRYFFPDDMQKNRDLLRFLQEMIENDGEEMERVVSTRLYGDSKYYERELKSKILSILRSIAKDNGDEETDDADLLLERGISRWPEVMEFRGPVIIRLKEETEAGHSDGAAETIDFSAQRYGAYINSETVRAAVSAGTGQISRVLTIENKAVYVWYLQTHHDPQEMIVYHGGCYSPMKGRWIRMLAETVRRSSPDAEFFHWSDIDAGGFRIFTRLKKNLIPELKPLGMDLKTLQQFELRAAEIETEHYRGLLRNMLEKSEYNIFRECIQYMLEKNIRLEQEAEII
ncbi:MAG: Wadjet anti-phage system protein JetD domain-containing protein [Eubacterium sp.]